MWNEIAARLGLEVPAEQLENLSPALDALQKATRAMLDRDRSAVDPAIVFRAEAGE